MSTNTLNYSWLAISNWSTKNHMMKKYIWFSFDHFVSQNWNKKEEEEEEEEEEDKEVRRRKKET